MTDEPLEEKGQFLIRELRIELKLLNQLYLVCPGPIRNNEVKLKWSIWPKYISHDNYFLNENCTHSDRSWGVLSCEIISFYKCFVVLELYAKKLKSKFMRNTIISKPIKLFNSNYDTTILKPVSKLCQSFKFVSSEFSEK